MQNYYIVYIYMYMYNEHTHSAEPLPQVWLGSKNTDKKIITDNT